MPEIYLLQFQFLEIDSCTPQLWLYEGCTVWQLMMALDSPKLHRFRCWCWAIAETTEGTVLDRPRRRFLYVSDFKLPHSSVTLQSRVRVIDPQRQLEKQSRDSWK